jgi:ferredoxin
LTDHSTRTTIVMVRVRIDPARCQGHARCFGLVPEIFDLDEQGNGIVKVDEPPTTLEEAVRRAVINCPEQAISVEDG